MKGQAADAALDLFSIALSALQRQDWAVAAQGFRTVAEQGDPPELRDRARQYLAICTHRIAEAPVAAEQGEGDRFLAAVVVKNRGDLAGALEICTQGGWDQKDERFAYLAASIHALEGRTAEATEALRRAIELNPTNRIHAFHDPDFSELRHEREIRQLFGLG